MPLLLLFNFALFVAASASASTSASGTSLLFPSLLVITVLVSVLVTFFVPLSMFLLGLVIYYISCHWWNQYLALDFCISLIVPLLLHHPLLSQIIHCFLSFCFCFHCLVDSNFLSYWYFFPYFQYPHNYKIFFISRISFSIPVLSVLLLFFI